MHTRKKIIKSGTVSENKDKNCVKVIYDRIEFDYEINALIRSIFPGKHVISKEKPERIENLKKAADRSPFFYDQDDTTGCIYIYISLSDRIFSVSAGEKGKYLSSSAEVKPSEGESGNIRKNKDGSKNPYRLKYKNSLKACIFKLLTDPRLFNEHLRRTPAWGTLTGVRPAKTASDILEKLSTKNQNSKYSEEILKLTEQAAVEELEKTYMVRHDRAELAVSVAHRESAALKHVPENGYSLYIGIPFCPGRCIYCSFAAVDGDAYRDRMEPYLKALKAEMTASAEICTGSPVTVYIGGGTPTELPDRLFKELLDMVSETFDFKNVLEYTVEAGRPDTINSFKLGEMASHGVTRVSVNPQTMKDETLKLMGRRHSAEDIIKCFETAASFGFRDINMDLIAGLPGEDIYDFKKSLDAVARLKPSCITVHSLVVKRASRLRTLLEEYSDGKGFTAEEKNENPGATAVSAGKSGMESMTDYALNSLKSTGYVPYYMYRQKNADTHFGSSGQENIGFCLPGHECLYNILMMEEKQSVISLGAGASSKLYIPGKKIVKRSENVKNVDEYIKRTREMIARKETLFGSYTEI